MKDSNADDNILAEDPRSAFYHFRGSDYYYLWRYYHHHAIPFVAHTRITSTAPPPRSIRVRPSVLVAEIDRIAHKSRPHFSYQPTEDFLNSMSGFDDETRAIRAHTNALLKRVHEPLPPRSRKPLLSFTPSYDVDPPMRITSDAYIQRMLGQNRSVQNEVETISYYPEPAKYYIGESPRSAMAKLNTAMAAANVNAKLVFDLYQ